VLLTGYALIDGSDPNETQLWPWVVKVLDRPGYVDGDRKKCEGIAMENEPKELLEGRAALSEAEADLANAQKLNCFRRGIDLLAEVIFGEYSEIHKNVANQLAAAYRNKVITKVQVILPEADSYELESLEHWRNVMETFTEAGLDEDPELKSCKDQMLTKWGRRLLQKMKPWEIESLKRELLQRK
jgi:hypothetical protein